MDARRSVRVLCALALLWCTAATYRTANFVVQAASEEVAQQVGEAAERYRRELALLWLGKEFPDWSRPCPITVRVAPNLGAGGVTSFYFNGGEVYGWRMSVQGSLERVLDSVLPHEVNHTIFATHFRQPLPRWADEGACTTVEADSERQRQRRMLIEFLQSGRGIAFSQMYTMKDYPRDVLPLYAQGHSLASYLIEQGGRRKFIQYLEAGLREDNWPAVTQRFYGFASLSALQNDWLDWVRQGSPPLRGGQPEVLVADNRDAPGSLPKVIYRGQSSDPPLAPPGEAPAAAAAGALVPVAGAPASRPASTAVADNSVVAGSGAQVPPTPIYAGQMPPTVQAAAGSAAATAGEAPGARPPAMADAAAPSGDGWHPPRRATGGPVASSLAGALLPRSAAADPIGATATSDASGGVVTSGLTQAGPQHTQAVRPRDFERPEQVILEWIRPRRAASPDVSADDNALGQALHERQAPDRILRR